MFSTLLHVHKFPRAAATRVDAREAADAFPSAFHTRQLADDVHRPTFAASLCKWSSSCSCEARQVASIATTRALMNDLLPWSMPIQLYEFVDTTHSTHVQLLTASGEQGIFTAWDTHAQWRNVRKGTAATFRTDALK